MTDLPMLRTSERKDFKRCPQRWWWGWRDGLEQNRQKSIPLWFGTGIHKALEEWYIPGVERGRPMEDTWREYIDGHVASMRSEVSGTATDGEAISQVVDAEGIGLAMIDNYLDTYGRDSDWEVISPEQTFQIRIADPVTKQPVVRYAGTFDLVARHLPSGKIWLWDHKTAKSIKTGHLPLDDQAGSYWTVADATLRRQGLLKPNEQISGILYNFLMKSAPDDRPVDEKGRSLNKPTKKHYVDQLLADAAAKTSIAREVWIDHDGPTYEKQLSKMKVSELEEMAAGYGITVLGDVSEKQPAPRFVREPVARTRPERARQVEHIVAEVRAMQAFKDGTLELYKNPTPDCTWDCSFYDLCTTDERKGDVEEFIDIAYHVRDPYEAHRESPGAF